MQSKRSGRHPSALIQPDSVDWSMGQGLMKPPTLARPISRCPFTASLDSLGAAEAPCFSAARKRLQMRAKVALPFKALAL